VDRDQARHAAAALIFRAHRMARPLGSDHQHIDISARLDQVEMHVEPVGEHQGRAVLHVGVQMIAVDVGLELVRGQHHDDIGPFGGLGHLHHGQLLGFGLLRRGRPLAQRDRNVLDARIAKVERVRMALAAIADNGDLLGLDQIDVGIAVIIHTHERFLLNAESLRAGSRGIPYRQ